MSSRVEARQPSHVKVAAASLIGTAIEWYDFFLYGTAAALIFTAVLSTFDPMVGTLLAFATYALGLWRDPWAAWYFGHLRRPDRPQDDAVSDLADHGRGDT